MKKTKKIEKAIDFQEYLAEQLKNPIIKRHYNKFGKQLEVAYQILQLRKQRGISQVELAKKLKTTQSNIARIESGKQNLTIGKIQDIAGALRGKFEFSFK
jgi:ribosome-binding protein aMBF1 (putative translation factor)